MYIQVRTIDAKSKVTVDISKTALVSDLKKQLEVHFKIKPDKQRLFFRGKQLEDEYTIFDYNINLNDVVQIMEKVTVTPVEKDDKTPATNDNDKDQSSTTSKTSANDNAQDLLEVSGDLSEGFKGFSMENGVQRSQYFQVGELVDVQDKTYGAWFEGKIVKIYKYDTDNQNQDEEMSEEQNQDLKADDKSLPPRDDFIYDVMFLEEGADSQYNATDTLNCKSSEIRPRAKEKIAFEKLKVGDKVLVNFNVEDQAKRGFWYESVVTKLNPGSKHPLIVDLHVGASAILNNCKILFPDEVMKIEEARPLTERKPNLSDDPGARETEVPHFCDKCKNNPKKNCKECGCHVCGLKTDENKQIMCDECDCAFHIWCLNPPLTEIPDMDEWYCHECKNDENEIVSAGSKLKESKKKAKMASKQNNTTRDWGKGMACIGRTKICTIVPPNHFGPIPGVEVGTQWKFRLQASEAGVHRPHVAGIHGQGNVGAFSVVLSGGYEDDVDNGNEVIYTGSGGRDLSGNKRTNDQGFDQTLTRLNKALALNCNAKLNEKGAEAKDWQAGKPVRVIRNYKLAKHSKYAPEEGNRYDGIYKVVKYYPEKGKSGFKVWKFVFRRDDPVPAPWTKEGKKRIESLGLEMQYPEGYLEALEAKDNEDKTDSTPAKVSKGKKRVLEESPQPQATSKKMKVVAYQLENNIARAIQDDVKNEKLWNECKEQLDFGKQKFMAKVEETFTCICCTVLVFKPITTPCQHNFCMECLKRSFEAEVMTCPTCRSPLEKGLLKDMNISLQDVLNQLFVGYSAAR